MLENKGLENDGLLERKHRAYNSIHSEVYS